MKIYKAPSFVSDEKREQTITSCIILNKEQLDILRENEISIDDVLKEVEKAQRQAIYKLLCKEKDYKKFYKYIKKLLYNGQLNESRIESEIWRLENE